MHKLFINIITLTLVLSSGVFAQNQSLETNIVHSSTGAVGDENIQADKNLLPRIYLDEDYNDWKLLPNLAQASKNALKVINDERYLYIYIETGDSLSLQNNNGITLYIDTDNNSKTGKSITGIGAEIEFRFGERTGNIYYENSIDTIGAGALFLIISPTVWSDRFEISLDLKSEINGKKLFSNSDLRIAVIDKSKNISIPSEKSGAKYSIKNYEFEPLKTYSMLKQSDQYIRALAHNVLFSSFMREDRKDVYTRLYQSVQPDIIGFSELYQDYRLDEITARLEEMLPSSEGKSWKARRTSDNVLATRFAIKYNTSAGPFGNGAFLIDLRPKYNSDLLVIVAHPTCCDNDSSRQDEVDAMIEFIRNAKNDKGDFNLVKNTPIMIMGDMNFVGDPRQVTTLLKGDIVQEDTYGNDIIPDWDDTYFEDAKPVTAHLPHTFTHTGDERPGTYSNGRLDYIFYSGSVLNLKNSFVMYTPAIPQDELSKHGIKKEDSNIASDHLPLIGDFELMFEQEETNIYLSRKNDKNGVPENINTETMLSGVVIASEEYGKDGISFIQDDQAAISVLGGNFKTGDIAKVSGNLSQSDGLTQLVIDQIKSEIIEPGNGKIPAPRVVSIRDILGQEWNGREILEGRLLKIENVQILATGKFKENTIYKITDDLDTMDIKIYQHVNLVDRIIPKEKVSISGCLTQFKKSPPYDSGYQLLPRSIKDLEIIKDIEHVSISKLRQNDLQGIPVYNDSVKSVSGIITATTEFGRNGPAFVQDDHAGIGIYGRAYVSRIQHGDSVTITGPLIAYRGVTEYTFDAEVSRVIVHKNVAMPEPRIVTISDILNQEWNGTELLEGKLVTLNDVKFIDSGVFKSYTNYKITDGENSMVIRINNLRDLNGKTIPKGKFTVTGIVAQNKQAAPFIGGYQLMPRFADDILER